MGDGQHPFGEAGARVGLAAERELAVDDRAAQTPLGGVVGGVHAVDLGEGPERRPELEQVAREGADVAVLGVLGLGALQQRAQAALERRELARELVAVAVLVEPLPGGEQFAAELEALFAEALLV